MSLRDELRERFERDLEDLSRLREELHKSLHRAGQETQEHLRDLEPKLAEIERRITAGGEELMSATTTLFAEVGRALREFSTRVSTPTQEQTGETPDATQEQTGDSPGDEERE
ncbi:hypothetical protein [Haliangium ochraceum]|uniref:Uncharacterized protein n=1 Tax=Haliangium ochraceum (strain DSM 14365 / JCM 11303 / SMP-2) TaxID=502025 RepID=D0LHY6_HALO1|nr:hypothetical protein [Haliangium ochraceum]ACY14815.1 hypothetical protein Hoch_2272 [Haliangium ochraceum DSM 14365]